MNLSAILLFALAIALVSGGKYLVGRLLGPRDIRADHQIWDRLLNTLVGFWSPVGNPEEAMTKVFSMGRKDPQHIGFTTVFRATIGWRFGYLVVVAAVVAFSVHLELTDDMAGQTPVMYYLLLGGFLIWGGVYMWLFRVEIKDDDLSCTHFSLFQRHFDLADLTGAKKTRDGYQLRFTGWRKISVPLFIEGHDTFKAIIIARLDKNER